MSSENFETANDDQWELYPLTDNNIHLSQFIGELMRHQDPSSIELAQMLAMQNPLRGWTLPFSNHSLEVPMSPSSNDAGSPSLSPGLSSPTSMVSISTESMSPPAATTLFHDRWRNHNKTIKSSKLREGNIVLRPLYNDFWVRILRNVEQASFGEAIQLETMDHLINNPSWFDEIDKFNYHHFGSSCYRDVLIQKNKKYVKVLPNNAKNFVEWIKGFTFGTDCCRHRNPVTFFRDSFVREEGHPCKDRLMKDPFNRPDVIITHLSSCKEVLRNFAEVYHMCDTWMKTKDIKEKH